jgi:hypothetical protein
METTDLAWARLKYSKPVRGITVTSARKPYLKAKASWNESTARAFSSSAISVPNEKAVLARLDFLHGQDRSSIELSFRQVVRILNRNALLLKDCEKVSKVSELELRQP